VSFLDRFWVEIVKYGFFASIRAVDGELLDAGGQRNTDTYGHYESG
jgi:hypothetical protein